MVAQQALMAAGIPEYDELKLRIQRGPDGSYQLVAFGPDGSTATEAFSLPFDKTSLDNFVLRVGRPRRGTRTYRSSQMEEAKRFGSELFESLIAGDVREVYFGARRVADANERGLRVTLYLTGVPELMGIPWEFLYERPSFLSQSIYTPLVRSLDLKSVPRPRKLTLPLRILGMVSRPQGFETLDVEEERRKLEQALAGLTARGMVELRWLERATLSELERVVGTPDELHVFHYIGHGAYDERTEGGILVLEDAHGRAHEVTGEELGSLLGDKRSLRLAILNSCEGARTSHVDPFSGVASSLVERAIPAVIGMQFEITDQAAIIFAERLYAALAHGFPVDAALAQARKAIFAAGNDTEFGTPVLFLRAAEARLFDPQEPPAVGGITDPPGTPELEPTRPPPPDEGTPRSPTGITGLDRGAPSTGDIARRLLRPPVLVGGLTLLAALAGVLLLRGGGDGGDEAPRGESPGGPQPSGVSRAQGTVTLGSDLRSPPTEDRWYCTGSGPDSPACTFVLTRLPEEFDRPAKAPFDGVVTRWQVQGARGPMRLVVLRGEVKPGGRSSLQRVQGSAEQEVRNERRQNFPTRLKIGSGEAVGLQLSVGAYGNAPYSQGTWLEQWIPPVGAERRRSDDSSTREYELLYNASVERDRDRDGFGDVTQDDCPKDPDRQEGC